MVPQTYYAVLRLRPMKQTQDQRNQIFKKRAAVPNQMRFELLVNVKPVSKYSSLMIISRQDILCSFDHRASMKNQ